MDLRNGRSQECNRVLIVDNQPLMGAGLERLLAAEDRLQVFGVTAPTPDDLVEAIRQAVPDVLVMTKETQPIDPYQLYQRLGDYGRLRIIQISLHSNTIQVFEMKQLVMVAHHPAPDDDLNDYQT